MNYLSFLINLQNEYDHVALKSIINVDKIVANGTVLSKHPESMIGRQKVGKGFWQVYIEVPIIKDEPLIRIDGQFKTIGDAAGRLVAWPQTLVFSPMITECYSNPMSEIF